MFRFFTSLRGSATAFFLSAVSALAFTVSCTAEPAQKNEQLVDTAVDTAQEGDGRIDNYDYESTDGHFTESGVWEQAPEHCTPPPFPKKNSCQGEPGMWGKALQMALWFFNVNKSGEGVYCTDVQWRGDAHLGDQHIRLKSGVPDGVDMSDAFIAAHLQTLDPDGNGEIDLSGGYYDAGDYIKFALTTGYMASTISWAMYEFPESFEESSLAEEATIQVKWAADYFMKNLFVTDKTLTATQWDVVAYAHQVGSATDHDCGWMPPELRDASFCPRQGFFATKESPAADVTANNAAALAQVSLITQRDSKYSTRALQHAVALYRFAQINPDAIQNTSGGLYPSEYAYDDLAWAAVWLYEATSDSNYLMEALDWLYRIPGFDRECVQDSLKTKSDDQKSECWEERWTHVWNSLRSGVFVRLAVSFSEAANDSRIDSRAQQEFASLSRFFQNIARHDSKAWMDSATTTPQGFSRKIADTWGSGRYNSAGQLVALVYARHFPDDDVSEKLINWAQSQSRYLLGENHVNNDPDGKSFVIGFTDISPNYPQQPHHAAGHASIFGLPDTPAENRHIIWGALVNGPVDNDTHIDERGDYGSNEITIDYNAALVGALAGNYYFQGRGQCPHPEFPPVEALVDEFYTMGKLNTQNECRSQVQITTINESIHPPRYNESLTVRYYVNTSEIEQANIDPATMTALIRYDNGREQFDEPTGLSGPFKCEDEENPEAKSNWYFVLNYEGYKFWGRQQQLKGPRTTQLDVGLPDGKDCVWNPSNDWSFSGMNSVDEVKTSHITAYGEDGKLLWGEEPPCHPIQHVVKDVSAE